MSGSADGLRRLAAAVGHEFNLGSPKQLEQVLFYELDLPKGKRTKTGYSTAATVLETSATEFYVTNFDHRCPAGRCAHSQPK